MAMEVEVETTPCTMPLPGPTSCLKPRDKPCTKPSTKLFTMLCPTSGTGPYIKPCTTPGPTSRTKKPRKKRCIKGRVMPRTMPCTTPCTTPNTTSCTTPSPDFTSCTTPCTTPSPDPSSCTKPCTTPSPDPSCNKPCTTPFTEPCTKLTANNRTYRRYTDAQVQLALAEIKNGCKVRHAGEKYNIPPSTLSNKSRGKYSKPIGGQQRISELMEAHIMQIIYQLRDWNIPTTRADIRYLVKDHIDSTQQVSRFKDNMPGTDWLHNFIKRNNVDISFTMISRKIGTGKVTSTNLEKYFHKLKEDICDIPPENIFSYDEVNITDNPDSEVVILRRGSRPRERLKTLPYNSTTVLFSGNATGVYLPFAVVCKERAASYGWTKVDTQGSVFDTTEHGWFDNRTFKRWFLEIFIKHVENIDGPIALVGDNIGGYFTNDVVQLSIEKDIRFVNLLPNSAYICQPLDVGVFQLLAIRWIKILKFCRKDGCVPKEHIPTMLSCLLNSMVPKHIIDGFEVAGISPFNQTQVLQRFSNVKKGGNTEEVEEESSDEEYEEINDSYEDENEYEYEEEITEDDNSENENSEDENSNDENDEKKSINKLNVSKIKRPKTLIKIKFTPPSKQKCTVKVEEDYDEYEDEDSSQTVLCQFCLDAWDENSIYRWIQCDYCDHWYHLQCSGVKYKRKEYYDVDLSDLDFKCTNCE